jgi:transcriptional regulator with XRE-family HTH domain
VISRHQWRAARAFLGWSQAQAARRAGINVGIVGQIERTGNGTDFNLRALRIAYESGGVRFGRYPDSDSIRVLRDRARGYRKVSARMAASR